jgi:hypothetical protein
MPEGLQDRARVPEPVIVHGGLKVVFGAFLDDLAILAVWRIGFAADLFDQFQASQGQLLQAKNFKRLVIKPVDHVFCPSDPRFGQQMP